MLVDLHNHTPRCNHAEGELEEYVNQAIEKGIKYFGFSDHAPMDFDQKYRMTFEEMPLYESEVLELKRKYSTKIKILLGYEVDYLKGHIDSRIIDAKVDYLIGSVHFLGEWGFDNPEFIGEYKHRDIDEIWQKYFQTIQEMAESNLFDIVGHIDLIKVFKYLPTKPIKHIVTDALKAIKKADMALEINMAGLRKPIEKSYPSREILTMAYELNIPITFASDAHKPEQVGLFGDEVVEFAKSVGYSECCYFVNRERVYVSI